MLLWGRAHCDAGHNTKQHRVRTPCLLKKPAQPESQHCHFAITISWACAFAASPGNHFWVLLSLCVMMWILTGSWGGWSSCVPPQIRAGFIRDWDFQVSFSIAAWWGSPGTSSHMWTWTAHPCCLTLNRPGKDFPSQPSSWSKGPSLCVYPHSLVEDRKAGRRVTYLKPMTFEVFACCCLWAVGLHKGRFLLPTFICWKARLLPLAPFIHR